MTKKNKLQVQKEIALFQNHLKVNPILRDLFFEVTDSCNLNCLHCGSSCLSSNRNFLDFSLIEKTLKEVASAYEPSKIWVSITGGEPLLYADLMKTIELSRKLGFRCGMTSNGTLISEEKAKQLADAGLETIAVSIDGLKDIHDTLRNRPGSFEQALKGVENLRKYGIEAQVISVIHKKNIHQLNEMFEFFQNHGFYSWRPVNIEPIGRAKINDELLLDADEVKLLLDFIKNKRKNPNTEMDVTFACSHFLPIDYEYEVRDFFFQCGAGVNVASIMVNGDIASCLDIERRPELVQGNVKTDSFIDIWENKFENLRIDRTEKSKTCFSCEHRHICGGDSTHTWNFDLNEPNYCIHKMLKEKLT